MGGEGIGRRSLLGVAGLVIARPLDAFAAAAAPGKPKVAIQTPRGVIVVELETVKAPVTANNFLRYVDNGKFDGGTFYRAVRTPGAPRQGTIQGGPSDRARRYPPIAHESTQKTGLKHKTGAISMGRNAPGSATADFFICASPQPYLDADPKAKGDNQGFAVFGTVVQGMDVVRAIMGLKTDGPARVPEMKGQMLNPPVPIVSMKRMA